MMTLNPPLAGLRYIIRRNLISSSFDTTLMLRIWAWLCAFSGFIVYLFYGISLYLFLAALGSLLAAAALLAVIYLFSEGLGVPVCRAR